MLNAAREGSVWANGQMGVSARSAHDWAKTRLHPTCRAVGLAKAEAYVAATLSGMPDLKTRARRSLRRWPRRDFRRHLKIWACMRRVWAIRWG